MTARIKLFLTGDPGCGKTTAVREVVRRLQGCVPMRGFWTEEVRHGGRRLGFTGVTLDGERFDLADREAKSRFTVGPYGVLLEGLETVGLRQLEPKADTRLIVLDEVGKMESFSEAFRLRVERLLEGETPLLGTVAVHGVGFVKRVRQDPRVTLLRMRPRSRDAVVGEILRRLARAGIAPTTIRAGGRGA